MISRKQILSALRAAARKLGHTPTRAEFMRVSGIHHCKLIPHFRGGYRSAVRAAGLNPNGVRIDTAAMLEDWGRLARKLGRVPTREEYDARGRYATASLETRFHRWGRVHEKFVEYADAGRLTGDWGDVVEMVRSGPIPKRGGGKRWLKQVGERAVSRDSGALIAGPGTMAEASPQAERALPAPLVGKRCVTMTMLAVVLGVSITAQASAPLLGGSFSRRVFPDRPVMGPPMQLAGMAHEPVNEMGVMVLFGMVAEKLGFRVEAVRAQYPDCEAKLEVEPGRWQRVWIEFEYESRKFRDHRHDAEKCDFIVCWVHNWPGRPKRLQVVELRKEIARIAEIGKDRRE
jgi:HNH endonuclease